MQMGISINLQITQRDPEPTLRQAQCDSSG